MVREVSLMEAQTFAKDEGLLFLGETSCKDNIITESVFQQLIHKVHHIQTDLVRRGMKHIEDLRHGEEERNVSYGNRCCY